MASEGEKVGARSRDEEIVLERDKITIGFKDKDCKLDANELLHNGEVPSSELEQSECLKLSLELQTINTSQSLTSSDCSPLFSRCSVDNPLIGDGISESSKPFSIVSYNILAECHAGGEFDSAPWITPEQLKIEYRHQNLLLELKYLNADAVCLQEVGPDYYSTILDPAMRRLGYRGQFLRRLGEQHAEGEATFYKTSCFDLVSFEEIFFSQIAEKDIEALDVDSDVKIGLRSAVASHAVMLLTRLSLKAAGGKIVTLGNIHVAFDEFKRPDLQCVQIAVAMRKMMAASRAVEPSIICGDFNCIPGTAPYQLLEENHLTQEHLSNLMKVTCADGQRSPLATFWPEGFSYPEIAMKSAYNTILGAEPITCWGPPWIFALDYIWYCSDHLTVKNILRTVGKKETENGIPNDAFPSDHLSLKATFLLK